MAGARSRRRSERGVAAVEAGLITMVLSPMVLGALFYGNYFWQAQKLSSYTPTVTQSELVGAYVSCSALLQDVAATVVGNVNHLAGASPIGVADVTATIVDYLPDEVGVDVRVSVAVPVTSSVVGSMLPHGGAVVSETLTRLQNVRLTASGC